MKLYHMPGDCSLSDLIVLEWIGVPLPIPICSSFCTRRSANLTPGDEPHIGAISYEDCSATLHLRSESARRGDDAQIR